MKSGWQSKRIGDVCRLMTGGTPNTAEPEYFGGDIKWLVSGDIHQGEIFDCEGRITEAGMKNSNAKLLPKDSVMIALNGQGKTRGTVAILRTEATCNQSLVSIYPCETSRLLPEFLYAYLHGRYQEIRRITGDSGNDRRGLNMDLIRNIRVPIAPLPEQQRIVSILDEAFEGIATAKSNAEKNLQNARAVFESHLNSVFTRRGNGWEKSSLGEVCKFIGGSQPPKSVFSKMKKADSIRLIQIRDYKSDNNVVYIPRAQARRFCNADDVMIGRYGPPLFQILRGLEGAYNVALMKAAPDESRLSRDFLFYFLKHSAILQYVIYHSERAAGQIGLTKETLEPYPIALPSLADQQKVIERIVELETGTQRLASVYERKFTALEALKSSLLHQAFTGQL
jgi:type I restriction enzyme S subunit